MESEVVYIIVGGAVLVIGLIMALNIGVIIWIKSALTRHKDQDPKVVIRTGDERDSTSTASKVKAWIGVLVATVGFLTTMGGALKSCDNEPAASSQPYTPPPYTPPPYVPPPQEFSSRCCTPNTTCPMMQMGMIGQECFCVDQWGNFSVGGVCR